MATAVAPAGTKEAQEGETRPKWHSATSHRVKVRCLTRMAERPTSAAEISRELNMTPSGVAYHVRKLVEDGLIELIFEKPARGAVEHFYSTVDLSKISDVDYAEASAAVRRVWVETFVSLCSSDVLDSLECDVLTEHDDPHFSRTPLKVDLEGWEAIKRVFAQAQDLVESIKAESEQRLTTPEAEPPMYLMSCLSTFEVPPRKDDPYLVNLRTAASSPRVGVL